MSLIEAKQSGERANRAHVVALGRRIDLCSMDTWFENISISLYEQAEPGGTSAYLLHSYSGKPGVDRRLAALALAMEVLGGMVPAGPNRLRFACGKSHRLACRRVFIAAYRLKPGNAPTVQPLLIADRASGRQITVEGNGTGRYQVCADGLEAGRAQRIGAIGRGLARLTEMTLEGGASADAVSFTCGTTHDALIGLLLSPALNLRAAMREQEEAMTKGLLVAPSAQQN
jgi:hypothetical protein